MGRHKHKHHSDRYNPLSTALDHSTPTPRVKSEDPDPVPPILDSEREDRQPKKKRKKRRIKVEEEEEEVQVSQPQAACCGASVVLTRPAHDRVSPRASRRSSTASLSGARSRL